VGCRIIHPQTQTTYPEKIRRMQGRGDVMPTRFGSKCSDCNSERQGGGDQYRRKIVVSASAQLVVVRLTCSRKGRLERIVRLRSEMQSASVVSDDETIHLTDKAPSESVPNYLNSDHPIRYRSMKGEGMHFAAHAEARIDLGIAGAGRHRDNAAKDRWAPDRDRVVFATLGRSDAEGCNGYEDRRRGHQGRRRCNVSDWKRTIGRSAYGPEGKRYGLELASV